MTETDLPGSSQVTETGYTIPFEASYLWRFVLHRINRNQEALILITGREATRGLGKTHLAVALARFIHSFGICPHCDAVWFYKDEETCPYCDSEVSEWLDMPELTAEKNTVVGDVDRYIGNCLETRQEAQIFDEVEEAADNRNPMAKSLRKFRNALMKLRMQNNVAIMTLPTAEVLDNSVQGLLDIWINVMRRGDARGYHFWVNDHTGQKGKWRMRVGNGWYESIHWNDMSGDPVVEELDEMKRKLMWDSLGGISEEFAEELENKKKEWKVEIMERLLANTETAQNTLATDVMDMSRNWGTECNHGRLPEQDGDDEKYPIRE